MSTDLMDYNDLVLDLLSSDSPVIPFDVTYRVLDCEGLLEGEVPAHKFLLALASPVLRRGFYNSHFEEKNKIDMKETTLQAFKAMLSIIYKRPVIFWNMPADELFELVNLAERYELPKLKVKLKQEMETMSVNKESVVEVAKTAMKFHQFEDVSKAVLDNCVKTLNKELVTRESFVKFSALYYGTGDEVTVMKLMSMMNNLQPPPCSNCQETPCKSGTAVTSVKQVKAGTVLAPNSDSIFARNWNIEQRGEAVVKSVEEETQRVTLEEGNGAKKYVPWGLGVIRIRQGIQGIQETKEIPRFLFHCRK